MNIASVQFPVFNPYQKATFEIYVSGCTRHCPGCHNPELQKYDVGKPFDLSLVEYMKEREHLFECISITGGDLLCQVRKDAQNFVNLLNFYFPKKEFWLFTGADWEEVPFWVNGVFDFIKVGKYKQREKVDGFPASKNQILKQKGRDY